MLKNVSKCINIKRTEFNLLDDILDTLRFRGSIFFSSNLAAPWGMSLPKVDSPRFHISLNGEFFIGTGNIDNQLINVKTMDIIMLPYGDMHWIADQANRQLISSNDASDACELGTPLFQQGKITNRLICGIVHYEKSILHPFLDSLPAVLHFSKFKSDDPIWLTVTLINSEINRIQGNKNAIIDRLTEVLFLQLLNKFIMENNETTGFFTALNNPRIYQVLEIIHQKPEFQWSLELLGKEVGMSRATLARKFKDAVGISPMTYILNWRMTKAHQSLKYSSITIDEISETVGFSSARTLNKAFQRHYGYTPSEFRRKIKLAS